MPLHVHFVLIGEGHSDDGLIPHLETLCIEAGADEVTGVAPDFRRLREPVGHTVVEKLRTTMLLEPQANLIFIHRDADARDPQARYNEIAHAVQLCNLRSQWVAIVPVQETEAWLLLDEHAIRVTAGKPNGRTPLNLPEPRFVENVASPKERLQEALILAAETQGRRLRQSRRDFPEMRRLLLQRLPTHGFLQQVPSWVRMREALGQAVTYLLRLESPKRQ